MKVIFRKSVIDQVLDAASAAKKEDRAIEKIELTLAECRRLRREVVETRRYVTDIVWPEKCLFDPCRPITKGDYGYVFDIRVEAAESA